MHLTNYDGQANTWTRQECSEEYWRAKTTDAYVDMTIDFIKEYANKESPQPFYINLWIYPTHSYILPTPGQLEPYKYLQVDYHDFHHLIGMSDLFTTFQIKSPNQCSHSGRRQVNPVILNNSLGFP